MGKIGDSLLVNDNYNDLKFGIVVNVEETELIGLYAPLTSQGNIVVDDTLATCYSDFDNHDLQNLAFMPFRWLYRLLDFVSSTNLKIFDADIPSNQGDDEVHWYGQGLHVLSHIIFPWKLWGGYPSV